MPEFHLKTLGDLRLYRKIPGGGKGRPREAVVGPSKGLAVCAFLATTPEGSARRSYLADLLWPESPPQRGRQSLRQAIYYVGQQAGVDLLRSEDDRLALRSDVLSVDVRELEEAAAAGQWREVVERRDGPFLPEVPGAAGEELRGWVKSIRDRVDARVRKAYRSLVEGHLAAGETEEAAARARDWTRAFPDSVDAHAALVRALVGAGDRAAAYRAYESYADSGREGADRLRRLVFRGDGSSGEPAESSRQDPAAGDGDPTRGPDPDVTGRHGWLPALLSAGVVMGGLAVAAVLG